MMFSTGSQVEISIIPMSRAEENIVSADSRFTRREEEKTIREERLTEGNSRLILSDRSSQKLIVEIVRTFRYFG